MGGNQTIQRLGFRPRIRFPVLHHLKERQQRLHDFLPQRIASGRLLPVQPPGGAFPYLFPGSDAPLPRSYHIVFQQINFFPGKSAEPRPEIAEYTFITKITRRHLQRRADIFNKRIQKNRFCLINKTWYPILAKDPARILAVRRQVPGNHCNILITAALPAHQGKNLPRGKMYFLHRVFGHMKRNGVLLPPETSSVMPQKVLFQKSKSRSVPKPWRTILPENDRFSDFCACLFCNIHKRMYRFLAQIKQLVHSSHAPGIFPRIQRNRHKNLVRQPKQFSQELLLDGRKPCKPIQQHRTSLEDS